MDIDVIRTHRINGNPAHSFCNLQSIAIPGSVTGPVITRCLHLQVSNPFLHADAQPGQQQAGN
jgi:hypothetical protein